MNEGIGKFVNMAEIENSKRTLRILYPLEFDHLSLSEPILSQKYRPHSWMITLETEDLHSLSERDIVTLNT